MNVIASVKNKKKKDDSVIPKINDKHKRFLFVNKFCSMCALSSMYINVKNSIFETNGLGNLKLKKLPENVPNSTILKLLKKYKKSGIVKNIIASSTAIFFERLINLKIE